MTAEADHERDHPDPHHSDAVRQADVAERGDVQQNAKAEGGRQEVVEFARIQIVLPHLKEAEDLTADVGSEPENGEGTHLSWIRIKLHCASMMPTFPTHQPHVVLLEAHIKLKAISHDHGLDFNLILHRILQR